MELLTHGRLECGFTDTGELCNSRLIQNCPGAFSVRAVLVGNLREKMISWQRVGGAGTILSAKGYVMVFKSWLAIGLCLALASCTEVNLDPNQTDGGEAAKGSVEKVEWIPHTKAAKQGDIRVSITSAKIGKVKYRGLFNSSDEEPLKSDDNFAIVRLKIENLSKTKKVDFRGWYYDSFSELHARLTDEHGNTYDPGSHDHVIGQHKYEALHPGKSFEDLVYFQVPVDAAKTLRLTLPARAFEGEGSLRFEIPKSKLDSMR